MIVCPRCSHENKDSAMNCANCRINLQWALENAGGEAPVGLQLAPEVERVAKPVEHVPRVETRPIRGFFVIALSLAVLAAMVEGMVLFWETVLWDWPPPGVQAGLALVVVGGSLTVAVLPRREPKPDLRRGLRLLAWIALIAGLSGGLLYGLMRLTLVILPEHTGQSLIVQYTLGERGFSLVNLGAADLYDAKLSGADLSGANLSGADLGRTNLREADLAGADLSRANLRYAYLRGADLREANLGGADLRQTYLGAADLSGADLRKAKLTRAYLRDADLREANLSGADLTGATVTANQLAQARSLKGTILPDGSVHE